jgi:hypothetical protein
MLTEDEALHVIELIENHTTQLSTSMFKNFSDAQKDNIREFDKAIIKKLKNREVKKVRTSQANKALHVYFGLVAKALNDAGYSVQYVLNKKKNDKIKKILDFVFEKTKLNIVKNAKEKILNINDVEIQWTMENVKSLIWKPIQDALFEIGTTTKLDSKKIDEVYKVLDKHLSENYGIESIPFPNKDYYE